MYSLTALLFYIDARGKIVSEGFAEFILCIVIQLLRALERNDIIHVNYLFSRNLLTGYKMLDIRSLNNVSVNIYIRQAIFKN